MLRELLRQEEVGAVTIVGLATDVCVLHTAQDALREALRVTVVARRRARDRRRRLPRRAGEPVGRRRARRLTPRTVQKEPGKRAKFVAALPEDLTV